MKQFFTIGLFIFISVSVNAQTWDGSSSTDWNTAANWNTNAVPISTGAVVIPGAGVTNWPVLANNVTIARISMSSGSQLNTAGFNITLTNTGSTGGCDITGATVTNPVAGNTTVITVPGGGTSLNGTTFNGNFHFANSSPNQTTYEANTAANTWNGNTTFTLNLAEGLSLSTGFPSTFNGDLTINVPATATGPALTHICRAGGVITGNFTLNFDRNEGILIGTAGKSIRVGGQLNILVQRIASSIEIYGLKNATQGGSVVVNNLDVSMSLVQDSFLVNSVNITQSTNNAVSLDSNYIQGTFTFNNTLTPGNQSINLRNTIFDGDVNMTTVATNINDGSVQRCYYRGNASFSTTTGSIILSNSDTSWFYKNLTVNTASNLTIRGARFVGAENSEFTQLGTQAVSIGRLIMQKTAGARLTLNDPVAVTTDVRFAGGNIHTTGTNYLRLNNLVAAISPDNTSHVVGPLQKQGIVTGQPFTFPVGTETSLNTVTMSNHGNTTAIFSADYKKMNPTAAGYDTSLHDPALQRISGCEYWDIQRLNGSNSVTLTFSFAPPCAGTEDYISNPAFARIARWTGSTWENLGNGGSTGTTTGTVTTGAAVSNFSPFTFASVDITVNALPVTLVSFTALKSNNKALLSWQTNNEVNLSHFEIERSGDGASFKKVVEVQAKNNSGSQKYEIADALASQGANFYRLKMVDVDGKFRHSHIVKVDFSKTVSVSFWPNPVRGEIVVQSDKKITSLEVVDVSGRRLMQLKPSTNNKYSLHMLQKGNYFLKIWLGDNVEIVKILVQ